MAQESPGATPANAAKEPFLTRDFALLFVANFCVVAAYFLLFTTLALFATTHLNASGAMAGLTASVFLVGGACSRIITSKYSARTGLKSWTLLALALQLITCVLYFVTQDYLIPFLVVRFVHGLAFGMANTTIPAIATMKMPKSRLGEASGYFMLSNTLAMALAPLLSLFVTSGLDYSVLFLFVTALTVVSLAVVVLVQHKDSVVAAKGPAQLINRPALKFSVNIFLVSFSYSAISTLLASCAAQRGLSLFSPFTFLVYAACLLAVRPIAGKMQDRRGAAAVLIPSALSMAVGLVLSAFAYHPLPLLLVGVFMATGFGTTLSSGQAEVARIVGAQQSAPAFATYYLLCDIGSGIGPIILGAIVSAAGFEAMYFVAAAVACAGAAYFVLYQRVWGKK